MSSRNRSTAKPAKAATREIPIGLIILGVGAVYIALCFKVFTGS